jgi:hypothetical protein
MPDRLTISQPLVADLWRTIKDARDEAFALGRSVRAGELSDLLRRMAAEGMAAQLPTIEEMRGLWSGEDG